MSNNLDVLIERYRQGAIGNFEISNPQKANKCHDQLHTCYKALREYEDGRKAIIDLMNDPNPGVRGWAAAHSLQWKPDVARRVLEALRDSQGVGSFDAEMTLKEYDKGRLTFDY